MMTSDTSKRDPETAADDKDARERSEEPAGGHFNAMGYWVCDAAFSEVFDVRG